jgi:hypothetical protein
LLKGGATDRRAGVAGGAAAGKDGDEVGVVEEDAGMLDIFSLDL